MGVEVLSPATCAAGSRNRWILNISAKTVTAAAAVCHIAGMENRRAAWFARGSVAARSSAERQRSIVEQGIPGHAERHMPTAGGHTITAGGDPDYLFSHSEV